MPGNYNFHFYQLQLLTILNKLFIIVILIGWYNDSWGYHGDDGRFFNCSGYESYGPLFTTGDTIGCCLNFINNTVFYTKNGVHLGSYYLYFIILK